MFRHLSDKELLNLFTEKRFNSPIIEELCSRLERHLDKEIDEETIECPVCLAKINIEQEL